MLEIFVSVDTVQFDASVDDYMKDDLLPALLDAINDVAEHIEFRLVEAMSEGFDRPNPYTVGAVLVLPARRGGSRDPAALIALRPRQAGYLDLQIHGGVRRAGDPVTTRLAPLILGSAAPRNAYGNLPCGYVKRRFRIRTCPRRS